MSAAELQIAAEPTPTPPVRPRLCDLRVKLTAEAITSVPEPRRYVLWTADGEGVLARGKVALFGARGGTGKSWALTQLAAAVATGTQWFGERGWQATPGRALLLLAEEDAEEATRRLHFAVRTMELDPAQVAAGVTLIPLAGHGVTLTTDGDTETGLLPETAIAAEIREILQVATICGRPYSLVVLDPLARFAGGEVEKDNAVATRFVQVLETFAAPSFGAPTVIASHHLRKQGSQDTSANVADLIRGASGLVDGVRWAAVLSGQKRIDGAPSLLRLDVPKTNYAKDPPPLILCRPENGFGTLRAATENELAEYESAAGTAQQAGNRFERDAELRARVLAALSAGPKSGNELESALHGKRRAVLGACNGLSAEGLIRRTPRQKWELVPVVPGGSQVVPGNRQTGSPGSPLKGGGTGNRSQRPLDIGEDA